LEFLVGKLNFPLDKLKILYYKDRVRVTKVTNKALDNPLFLYYEYGSAMKTVKHIILAGLLMLVTAGIALSADLTPQELRALLVRADEQAFDARDRYNRPVQLEAIEKFTLSKLFDFTEKIQQLKTQLGISAGFESSNLLRVSNIVYPFNKANLFPARTRMDAPPMNWGLIREKQQLLSGILAASSAAIPELNLALTSFLLLTICALPSLAEPRFRFHIKRE